MKILLRSKFYKILGGTKNIGGGLISALDNQRKMLNFLGIPFTEDISSDWDVMQVNIPWPVSVREAKRAKRQGKKIVMWSHVTVEDLEQSIGIFKLIPFLSTLVRKYLKRSYSIADLIFCPSEYTRNLLIGYGLPPEKLFAQSNAVDTETFFADEARRVAYREKYNLTGIVVGNVSLVIPRKGVSTFINLSKKFTNNKFVWFGKIFNKLLVGDVPKTSTSNISFTGFTQDAVAALNAIDVFVFPSIEENQGMVVLEAAAVGLPILVRDIPVYNGWLVHGVNCLKAKTEEEFETHLIRLLEESDLRESLKKEALVLAEKESIKSQSVLVRRAYDSLSKI